MINCKETLARLYEYLDHELSPERAAEVTEHLEACRHCFDRAEFERTFGRFVREAGSTKVNAAPLKDSIRSRLAEMEASDPDEELFPDHQDVAPIDEVTPPPTNISDAELARMRRYYAQREAGMPGGAMEGSRQDGNLNEESRARAIPFWSYLLVAAAVVLIAVPLIRKYASDSGPDPMVQALIALHTEDRPAVEETDPVAMTAWLKANTIFEPMAAGLVAAGCTLKGVAVDTVWGTQLVHLFAESVGEPVSLIETSDKAFVMPKGLGVLMLDEDRYWTTTENGCTLLIWKDPDQGMVCIAMAKIAPKELGRIIEAVESATPASAS